MYPTSTAARVLVVDDEPNNLQVMKQVLSDSCHLLFAKDGHRAIALAQEQQPDLILLDVMMPEMDGFETCRRLKADELTSGIPIIFVTAMTEIENESLGFELGAVDYISKPISPSIVRARVRTHLSLVHVNELQRSRLEVVRRLGRAAEYKDNETGLHVIRMSHYSRLLARAIGEDERYQDMLLNASPMHDIGKIGVPDHILLKPGPLNDDEWRSMKLHPSIGADILGEHHSPLLQMAKEIALTHHERWDGSGYPAGLAGENIPLSGRIVAVADVFDALTTERPYKDAWPVEKAVDLIVSSSGSHFDPKLVGCFIHLLPDFLDVKQRWDECKAAEYQSLVGL